MTGEAGVPPGCSAENTPVRPVVELTPEFATSVAYEILEVAQSESRRGVDYFPIDECWVGEDLSIYLRYRLGVDGSYRAGWRIHNPHIDPTSSGYALDSHSQGFYFYHDLAAPPEPEWVDRLGYRWYGYGPTPSLSWEAIVDQQPRIITLRELAAGGAR